MKDAYSFHATQDSLAKTYDDYRQAYAEIFRRCGLHFIEAQADSGSIGGDQSSEFLVIADAGEDHILVSDDGQFAANVEACPSVDPPVQHAKEQPDISDVHTPNHGAIDSVASFLGISSDNLIKTLLVMDAQDQPILVCLRGDKRLNDIKLARLLGGHFRFATSDEVHHYLQTPVGFVGPVGNHGLPIYMDTSLYRNPSYVCGANRVDTHFQSVVIHRDISHVSWVDIRDAESGDPCPVDPSQSLVSKRGIEVGHVFQLGQKYSESMNVGFTNQAGEREPYLMGCYGIGVGRTLAAAIEQHHDEKGIVWPRALAPFDGVILHLFPDDSAVTQQVESVVDVFNQCGMDVIVDDRNESPGVKFKDAELIGCPFYIPIGKKSVSAATLDCTIRKSGEIVSLPLSQLSSIESMI